MKIKTRKKRRPNGSHKDCKRMWGEEICNDCHIEVCPDLVCDLGRKDAFNFRDNYETCKNCESYDSCLDMTREDEGEDNPKVSDTFWDSSKHKPSNM